MTHPSNSNHKLQPNSRYCFVCGLDNRFGLRLRFHQTGPGEVTAEYTAPEHFQGYPGVVHGGIVAAMLDELSGRAHMVGNPPRFMYTARLEIRYRKTVPVGQPLRLIARAGESRGRSAEASSQIFGPDGTLLAEANAVLVDVPKGTLDLADLESLGWKVYPEEIADHAETVDWKVGLGD